MKRYRIKSSPGTHAFLEVVAEVPGGYSVTVTRFYDGYETNEEEFMSSELFETCIRTAYLEEIDAVSNLAFEAAS